MDVKRLFTWMVVIGAAVIVIACTPGTENSNSAPLDPPQEDYTGNDNADHSLESVLDMFDWDEDSEANDYEGSSVEDEDVERTENEGDETASNEEGSDDGGADVTVQRTLYVFDHQGYVAPITLELPSTQSAAQQVLEHMVVGGPVSTMLPDGMRAVFPAGTEMTVDIKGSTAKVDFSPEFTEYAPEDEKGMIEAITWTLTEFDAVDDVIISINGYEQDTMPIGGTPLYDSFSRHDGINVELNRGVDMANSTAVTVYFEADSPGGDFQYVVPVTRVIDQTDDYVVATVNELISGPRAGSGLASSLLRTSTLQDATLNGSTATLQFDDPFWSSDSSSLRVENMLHVFALSLTENSDVDEVRIRLNADQGTAIAAELGLHDAVTRPSSINPVSF